MVSNIYNQNSTNTTPIVTFIIPAFNVPASILKESINSVALQTFNNFEAIIVDESTDSECAALCKALCETDSRFIYLRPPNRLGLAGSLNFALEHARGEFIARFDSDDVCMPNRLELQVGFMMAHPNVDVLGGGLEIINEVGQTLAFRDYPADHALIEKRFQTTTQIAHPTVMMRKRVIVKFGGYDSTFRFAEDLDLWLRLLNNGVRFANLQAVLVRYRQQNTCRNPVHFRFNLRARLRNFSFRHLPRRVLGICAIAVFCRLPAALQERVFHGLLFRRS